MTVKVTHLTVEKFRRFRDITVPFGDRVTLIAGQNGTSKSTLLGMLAQPFSFGVARGRTARSVDASAYTDNYHGIELSGFSDLANARFMYDCDDVFRLSQGHDFGERYTYRTHLSLPTGTSGNLPNNTLVTTSRDRARHGQITGMRFVTGPGLSHRHGEGNFPHPVIYLGLNRLWPLAATTKCTFPDNVVLSSGQHNWYVEKYNEILCLNEDGNTAKFMETKEKRRTITPQSRLYDGESCSAGQDNLGQLLTAVLSFRWLKDQLGSRYQGGMLLIDELDATLHTFAQDKILEMLCTESWTLDLQIIATTHSTRLLEKALRSRLSRDVRVLYLTNVGDSVTVRDDLTFQEMCDLLSVEVTQFVPQRPAKVSVIFEDDVGKQLFNQICGTRLREYVKCDDAASLGGGHLSNLAHMSTRLPALRDVILLPDGDVASRITNQPPNLLCLPGTLRPETLVYRHLFSMCEADPFWRLCGNAYTRQFAITRQGGTSLAKGDDKDWVKNWYRAQSDYWGRGNARVLKLWIQSHKAECLLFCQSFIRLLRGRFRGSLNNWQIERVYEQFQ